jgi:NAD(P)H-flavin reductase
MVPQSYRVRNAWPETHDTFTLELVPPGGANGLSFAPGQFNMLYLFGVGEVPISISGDPARPLPLVHTVRAVGTVTQAMKRLEPGQALGVRGPFGSHWPLGEAAGRDVVMVAGGIGLAPLRPVVYQLLTNRAKYGRIALLYGARTPRDLLYEGELSRWRGRSDLEVEVTVDTAPGGWHGRVGVVTTLLPQTRFDPANAVALICGPEVMMRFTVLGLRERGVPPGHIYLSLERNMKCAVGFCGHCQLGPAFVCKDGPVFRYDRIRALLEKREV